jgi:hypothetical protein
MLASKVCADPAGAAAEIARLQKELADTREQVVWGFYEEAKPSYHQGIAGMHELTDPITAAEANAMVARIQELLEANNREVERRREAERKLERAERAERALIEALSHYAKVIADLSIQLEDLENGGAEAPDERQEELDLGNPGLERLMKRQPPWERGEGC